MNKIQMNTKNGITLISLVVTIIILIILTGIIISFLLGENGIIKKTEDAKDVYESAANDEQEKLNNIDKEIDNYINGNSTYGKYNKEKGINTPLLLTGITPFKYTFPTSYTMGETKSVTEDEINNHSWYEYGTDSETKRWANVITKNSEDTITGYWIWIPRYAYKLNGDDKTVDIVFLVNDTDNYYDENGELQTAIRATQETPSPDTKGSNYVVHPAFTNESSINFVNGGWDKELSGIWVAKFEAGYAEGNSKPTNNGGFRVVVVPTT